MFFYVKLNHPFLHFLGYPSFVNTMEKSSLYQLIALEKVFWLPEIHNINSSFILKFISPSFLLNMNFPFVQKVHAFIRIKELFCANFSWVKTWYMTVLVPPEIPWSRIWHLNFTETKKSHQYFNWNSYQPWSNTPYKK